MLRFRGSAIAIERSEPGDAIPGVLSLMPVPFKHADFLRLIDCLSDGVYVMDADRSIVAWSRGAERITGYSAA